MAVCVAVIGKDNGPLYFCTRSQGSGNGKGLELPLGSGCGDKRELGYSFVVSSALDIVEEKVHHTKGLNPDLISQQQAQMQPTRELYLGALTAQEDYKVYGYMTNTKIKFILVIEEGGVPLRENDIRMMFRKLHGAFCDLMANPFYQPGSEIKSKKFETVVNSILAGQS